MPGRGNRKVGCSRAVIPAFTGMTGSQAVLQLSGGEA
jgi:hypothetical protein